MLNFFEEYDKSQQSTPGKRAEATAEASAPEQRGNVSSSQTEMPDTFTLQGKAIYASQCSGCHGEAGDGQGMLTLSWLPRPRNFVHGSFRYRSTPSGSPPTDTDLFHTVSKGLAGSGMPAFEAILSEQERWDVVAYMKQLSPRFASGSEPSPTPGFGDTPGDGATHRPRRVDLRGFRLSELSWGRRQGGRTLGSGFENRRRRPHHTPRSHP